jgi:hypothetical protein
MKVSSRYGRSIRKRSNATKSSMQSQERNSVMLHVLPHFMPTAAVERVRLIVAITATTLAFVLVIAIVFIA